MNLTSNPLATHKEGSIKSMENAQNAEAPKWGPYGIQTIQSFLPHRFPFLFVDRILDVHFTGDLNAGFDQPLDLTGSTVRGLKNVSVNEPFFEGHFPGNPIMPGVLLVEMMAQVCAFGFYPWASKDIERFRKECLFVLVGVEDARFRRPIVPGDTLHVEGKFAKTRGRLYFSETVVTVDGQKACEATLIASLTQIKPERGSA